VNRELVKDDDEREETVPFVDISAAFRTCWMIKDGTRTLRSRQRVAKQFGAQMTICSFNGRKRLLFIGHGSRAKMKVSSQNESFRMQSKRRTGQFNVDVLSRRVIELLLLLLLLVITHFRHGNLQKREKNRYDHERRNRAK
jgi:hypothetical protein